MALRLYNCLLTALAPALAPYLALRSLHRGRDLAGVAESFGRLRAIPPLDHETRGGAIWLHAVSVGESLAAAPLVRELRERFPGERIVVSASTPTGRRMAEEKLAGEADAFFYCPFDFAGAVRRTLRAVRPRLVVILETEIWPNLFRETQRHGARLLLVNGRISDRSAPRYRRFRGLFGPALGFADQILAQSEQDAERFVDAGAPASAVRVGGNLKYDFELEESPPPADLADWLHRLGAEPVLVAGSTREGEEPLVLDAFRAVAAKRPRALLILAPRHPQRFDEAAEAVRASGLPWARRTALEDLELPGVLLLDSLGELASLYARADAVFVGGSLNGWGGHNVLEPALFGKPVVVGPDMQNFREIADRLQAAGGLVRIPDAAALAGALSELLDDPDRAKDIGEAGRAMAEAQRGAAARAADAALALWREAAPATPPGRARRLLLGPVAALWAAGARLHGGAYRRGLLGRKHLPRPVVSVGNLSVGGAGKTPAVLWLADQLWRRGLQPAVLTRGYRRISKKPVELSLPDRPATVEQIGDEAAVLQLRFEQSGLPIAIGVGGDRHAAGRALLEETEVDVFLLDDGFQHHRLHRDFDLVLLDVTAPLDAAAPVPVGRLRESPRALARADAFLLTRTAPGACYARLRRQLTVASPAAPVLTSRMQPIRLIEPRFGEALDPVELAGRRVYAFCGVGRPESFWQTLQGLGAELVGRRAFGDHHRYTLDDWWWIASGARDCGADAVATTEKDLANLSVAAPPQMRTGAPTLYVLQIELEVDDADPFLDDLEARIEAASSER